MFRICMAKGGRESLRPSYGQPKLTIIAPKASGEGACILSKMGYCYGVWLVTVIMVRVVTVML